MRVRAGKTLGAGVAITADRLVATNAHVVGRPEGLHVETVEGQRIPARVLVKDVNEDLELLRVDGDLEWSPAPIQAGTPPSVGAEVYVIGHPLGLGWTVTRGIVSSHRHPQGHPMIQTDAAISPGNSGGPLIDSEGHVIGIVTSKLSGGGVENVAFARPTAALLSFLERSRLVSISE
ncbi:MAG: S1C family serine protease [Planctomycetota bacterium]